MNRGDNLRQDNSSNIKAIKWHAANQAKQMIYWFPLENALR